MIRKIRLVVYYVLFPLMYAAAFVPLLQNAHMLHNSDVALTVLSKAILYIIVVHTLFLLASVLIGNFINREEQEYNKN